MGKEKAIHKGIITLLVVVAVGLAMLTLGGCSTNAVSSSDSSDLQKPPDAIPPWYYATYDSVINIDYQRPDKNVD